MIVFLCFQQNRAVDFLVLLNLDFQAFFFFQGKKNNVFNLITALCA